MMLTILVNKKIFKLLKIMLPSYKVINQVESPNKCSLTAEITFLSDCVFFDGHFDEFVLLPAVAQLFVVQSIAERYWGELGSFSSLKQVKFRDPIYPNTMLNLHLEYIFEEKMLTFRYQQANNEILKSSGKIVFRNNNDGVI